MSRGGLLLRSVSASRESTTSQSRAPFVTAAAAEARSRNEATAQLIAPAPSSRPMVTFRLKAKATSECEAQSQTPNPQSQIRNPEPRTPESLIPFCAKLPRMLKQLISALIVVVALPVAAVFAADVAKTANGSVEGVTEASGIHVYRGIPFAAPPTGELRWKPPQPVKNWDGVRKAAQFGAALHAGADLRRHELPIERDERGLPLPECLDPCRGEARRRQRRRGGLPVLVYFYGGGFVAGDGSEPRYDGETMARKGIVALTVNYRLGVFGFFAHPELTKESPHHASGNYALLDRLRRCSGSRTTSRRSAATRRR